jgi:predicted AlkP superfamily pyrophosphatase or phosphodiesterase
MKRFAALLLATFAAPTLAQVAPAPRPAAPVAKPRLIVAISVDQLSADLFAQYRSRWTRGFARLLNGQVFPSAYQGHAATETCPGHSTILTGVHPARSGIIANQWIDQSVARADKTVYCAEDPTVPGSTSANYTASDKHLRVPTLGERMKQADPATRVVAVAGKDRAAIMMGGHQIDELWWWKDKDFVSYAGRTAPPVVTRTRAAVAALLAQPQAALPLPGWCAGDDRPVQAGAITLGQGRFQRAAGDARAFRASPASDAAVLGLAAGLIQDMKLGRGAQTDLIAIGLSATDYVGHSFGTGGTEMCIQLDQLDQALGSFLDALDGWNIDYQVVLTADHGAHDVTERHQQRAMPMASRLTPAVSISAIGKEIGAKLGLTGPVLLAADNDIHIPRTLPAATRARVQAEVVARLRAQRQVAAVLTRAEIAATPLPTGLPENWTLAERARASYDSQRSGDLLVLFNPRVTPIPTPAPGYVETHGSPWDYDRRVPLVFWRKGTAGFEQPLSVQTVDIAPTLAALLRLPMPDVDGRCLDLDGGAGDSCRP